MTTSSDDRASQLDRDDDTPLTNLSTQERDDLQDFVDDEAARAAEAELPPVEVAASVITAQSDVLDNVTSLTETDEPEIGPLTLKEAYGESIGRALTWSDDAQVCLAASGGDSTATYVDADGLCASWNFIYCNASSQYLSIVIRNGQSHASENALSITSAAPFSLDDVLDSPEIVTLARDAGLDGDALSLRVVRDEAGVRAQVTSGDQHVVIDPTIVD